MRANYTIDVRDAKIAQLQQMIRDKDRELEIAYNALTHVKVCTCHIEKRAEEARNG